MMLSANVPQPVGLALATLGTEETLELRVLATLPVLVALQRILARVRATTALATKAAPGTPATRRRRGVAGCCCPSASAAASATAASNRRWPMALQS